MQRDTAIRTTENVQRHFVHSVVFFFCYPDTTNILPQNTHHLPTLNLDSISKSIHRSPNSPYLIVQNKKSNFTVVLSLLSSFRASPLHPLAKVSLTATKMSNFHPSILSIIYPLITPAAILIVKINCLDNGSMIWRKGYASDLVPMHSILGEF